MLKISIVTVSYNAAETIEQTISSVVNQAYENIEYIIIDGGSTDGTVDIIRKYEDRIAYWVSEPDKGIYDAMNKGIDAATGDYIYFLGADDILLNLPIISISNAWHDNIDIILGKVEFSNGYVYSSKADWKLIFHNRLHHQGMFVKRIILENNKFNTNYTVYADFDLNQKLYKKNVTYRYCDDIVAIFSLNGISSCANLREQYSIIFNNYGILFALLSVIWTYIAKIKNMMLGNKY